MRSFHHILAPLGMLLGILGIGSAYAGEGTCTFDQMQIDPSSVIESCSKVVADQSLVPEARADAFYIRGRAYGRTKRVRLAAQDYDVAIKLAPMRSDYYVSRSNAEYKLGQDKEGWDDLNRALTLDPKNARAYRDLGQAYKRVGDWNGALEYYSHALELDPGEPYSLMARSEINQYQHKFKEALADASALVAIPLATINKLGFVDARGALTNFHVVALDFRAKLYEAIGNEALAAADLDAALAEQRSADTLKTRADHLLRFGQSAAALADLDEAVRLDPDAPGLYYARCLALAGLHRYEAGLAAVDKAIELHSAPPYADTRRLAADHVMRARMLRGLGRTDDAVAMMEKAVQTSDEERSSAVSALTMRGYWNGLDEPAPNSPAFKAALRACMIDVDCN